MLHKAATLSPRNPAGEPALPETDDLAELTLALGCEALSAGLDSGVACENRFAKPRLILSEDEHSRAPGKIMAQLGKKAFLSRDFRHGLRLVSPDLEDRDPRLC